MGLATKLTNAVLLPVATGMFLIFVICTVLILEDVPDWGTESKDVMVTLEVANMGKLAANKAKYIGDVFGRLQGDLLQLQAFAEQILVTEPTTMVVDDYLKSFSGLQQSSDTWDYSTWYITGFTSGTSTPASGSSLDGLLNRTALMDVPFRGLQLQEPLIYLSSLDDPSAPDDPDASVAFQAYPGYNMSGITIVNQECDDRFNIGDGDFTPSTFDPRCRVWFQDARESGGPVFSGPYQDWGTGLLTITPAVPVYAVNDTSLLGVVGIDMNFGIIEASIFSLEVLSGEGYAYLLAPDGDTVAVHPDLDPADPKSILDLEVGVDENEFEGVVTRMTEQCSGSATYQKNGETWLISWEHEQTSGSAAGSASVTSYSASGGEGGSGSSSAASACSSGGFIVAVTVREATLLGVFSATESSIRETVTYAVVAMALILVVLVCCTIGFARSLSKGLTQPVAQLVHIVRSLNSLDFSQQDPGLWMLNEVTCPEVVEMMEAFKMMTTVIRFANLSLEGGNVDEAQESYTDALLLFEKLGNSRGVAIVRNNLGNVYTLQGKALSRRAKKREADQKFEDAVSNYREAIEDAQMRISWMNQSNDADEHSLRLFPLTSTPSGVVNEGEVKMEGKDDGPQDEEAWKTPAPADSLDVAEAQGTPMNNIIGCNSSTRSGESAMAFKLQLANRVFNLALCLAAKAGGDGKHLPERNDKALAEREEAKKLIRESEALAAERTDRVGSELRVEYLLKLAELESAPHKVSEVLKRAESIVAATPDTNAASWTILRQRLLASRGNERLAAADIEGAVGCWTEALVSCEFMDPAIVINLLSGLKKHVFSLDNSQGGNPYSEALDRGFGLSEEGGSDGSKRAVLNAKLKKSMATEEAKLRRLVPVDITAPVRVDLCFVMDCTGSMARWINQAKKKLLNIIEQTKKDISNLELRVAFVGYRDFDGRRNIKQYEGPYDFHSEQDLPQLEAKLKGIVAGGGCGYVADVAGALKHATEMTWTSDVRLCILFADAPCHGQEYHNVPDAYPGGCPRGVNPTEMIFKLQHELAVDFYFIRIAAVTDTMVDRFKEGVKALESKGKSKENKTSKNDKNGGNEPAQGPKFVVHNLGSNDNTFVDTVVQSVKGSAGLNLRMEQYT